MGVMTPINRVRGAARHRVIGYSQLLELGYSREVIRHWVRTERLYRVHRAVYAVGDPQLAPAGCALAATLATGGYLSHRSAAALWGLLDIWPTAPQVTSVGSAGTRGPASVELHHSTTLTSHHARRRRGIPVTDVIRTLTDCARTLHPHALKSAVQQAERLHGLKLHQLDRPGLPARLRDLLDSYVAGAGVTANEFEARFFEICAQAGLPRPEAQAHFGVDRVDFVWADLRLVVETDGRETHDNAIAFTDDRVRDRRRFAAGYATLRYTWAEVTRFCDMVAAELVAAHVEARRRRASWG